MERIRKTDAPGLQFERTDPQVVNKINRISDSLSPELQRYFINYDNPKLLDKLTIDQANEIIHAFGDIPLEEIKSPMYRTVLERAQQVIADEYGQNLVT